MKLIHCADLHLDASLSASLSGEQAKTRKLEILRTFIRMVDYAKEQRVRAILITGNLFDARNVSATVRNQVTDKIIENPSIDFIVLRGEKDKGSFLSQWKEAPENLLLFSDNWISYTYGAVRVTGAEGFSPERRSELYGSLELDPERYNIVALQGRPEEISQELLANRGIDYLALGQNNDFSYEKLDDRGSYCYPGCLEGRNFDECGIHGFVLLDIDEKAKKAEASFVPIAYRTLYTIPVDMTGIRNMTEAAEKLEATLALEEYPSTSLIRFVLTGETLPGSCLNPELLEEQFRDYFYQVKVVDRSRLKLLVSDYEKDASLRGEFMRMVMAADLDEADRQAVIRCGLGALAGEVFWP